MSSKETYAKGTGRKAKGAEQHKEKAKTREAKRVEGKDVKPVGRKVWKRKGATPPRGSKGVGVLCKKGNIVGDKKGGAAKGSGKQYGGYRGCGGRKEFVWYL